MPGIAITIEVIFKYTQKTCKIKEKNFNCFVPLASFVSTSQDVTYSLIIPAPFLLSN